MAIDLRSGRLELSGELDLHSVPLLREAVFLVLSDGWRPDEIVLEQLSFIDAAGADELAAAYDVLRGRNPNLACVQPHRRILRVLEIFDLLSLVEHPTT